MHHYNFPAYSVGEARGARSTNRREKGHGALAERALEPGASPRVEEFPYAIRVVSEVLSSNGSTSQGSICGSTLALMDAGVPIKAPVAGISCGLIQDDDGVLHHLHRHPGRGGLPRRDGLQGGRHQGRASPPSRWT